MMSVFWGTGTGLSYVAAADAAEAKRETSGVRRSVDELQAKLDRTLLACEALWTLVRDKLGVTDVELLDRINQIDLSDGKLDGKVRKTAVSCPSCGRTLARRFPKCVYCGQVIMRYPFA